MTSLSAVPVPSRLVLVDRLPTLVGHRAATDVALVVGGALVVALFAQLTVPLPFTPVPLTLSTFAVLLTGAALGPARAGLAMLLYIGAGVLGAPFYAEGASGWALASFGYILAYAPAALLAGFLARRGGDRTPLRTGGLVLAASVVLYLGGVPWLMALLDVGLTTALSLGVVPFLVGDAVKAALLCALLPSLWRITGTRD